MKIKRMIMIMNATKAIDPIIKVFLLKILEKKVSSPGMGGEGEGEGEGEGDGEGEGEGEGDGEGGMIALMEVGL
jgi:hypothetical protein